MDWKPPALALDRVIRLAEVHAAIGLVLASETVSKQQPAEAAALDTGEIGAALERQEDSGYQLARLSA